MIRYYILLFATLFALNSFSQNLNVNFGELFPTSKYADIIDAGVLGDKLIVIVSEKDYKIMKFYDPSTMKLITSKVIQQKSCMGINNCIDNDFHYIKTIFSKDNAIMIFNSYEKTSKQHILFAQKFDKHGDFDGKLVIIDKISSESRRNAGSFMVWPSNDSTKFMVIQNPPYEKYQGEQFNFKVYNMKLENLSNFGASLPYKDKDVSVSDYYLGNDGKIYLLVNILKEEKEKGQDRSFYSILSTDGKSPSFSEFLIRLPDKDIETIALRLDDKNNKIICSGLYCDITKGYTGKTVDGIFYLKVDINKNEIEASSYKKIDPSVLAAILDIKESKVEKKSRSAEQSKYFEIKDIISRNDGSASIITEYRLLVVTTTRTTNSNGTTTTTTTYRYYRKNIFVINVGADGSILSFTDIPKNQQSVNDGGKFLSFLLFQKDDRIIMIYNDHPENMDPNVKSIKDVETLGSVRKSVVVAVELNKDGSYSKQKVYDVALKKIAMLPEKGIKISNGKYIIPIEKAPGAVSCGCITMFSKIKSGIMKIEM